jgi:hypothetical protein
VKDTDDDKQVDGSDAGAVPATSTNSRQEYNGIRDFSKLMNLYWKDKLAENEKSESKLIGQTVHGVKDKRPDWYYTQREWDRVVGIGKVPDERNTELRGVNQDRRTDEKLSEESDTKT